MHLHSLILIIWVLSRNSEMKGHFMMALSINICFCLFQLGWYISFPWYKYSSALKMSTQKKRDSKFCFYLFTIRTLRNFGWIDYPHMTSKLASTHTHYSLTCYHINFNYSCTLNNKTINFVFVDPLLSYALNNKNKCFIFLEISGNTTSQFPSQPSMTWRVVNLLSHSNATATW